VSPRGAGLERKAQGFSLKDAVLHEKAGVLSQARAALKGEGPGTSLTGAALRGEDGGSERRDACPNETTRGAKKTIREFVGKAAVFGEKARSLRLIATVPKMEGRRTRLTNAALKPSTRANSTHRLPE
jgi:hypothetical protein